MLITKGKELQNCVLICYTIMIDGTILQPLLTTELKKREARRHYQSMAVSGLNLSSSTVLEDKNVPEFLNVNAYSTTI